MTIKSPAKTPKVLSKALSPKPKKATLVKAKKGKGVSRQPVKLMGEIENLPNATHPADTHEPHPKLGDVEAHIVFHDTFSATTLSQAVAKIEALAKWLKKAAKKKILVLVSVDNDKFVVRSHPLNAKKGTRLLSKRGIPYAAA